MKTFLLILSLCASLTAAPAYDQVSIDTNLPDAVLYCPAETGLYAVAVDCMTLSPGSSPTQVQVTVTYNDEASLFPTATTASYTVTLNAANAHSRAVDLRPVSLVAGYSVHITAVVLVKTGSVTYQVKAGVLKL